MDSFHLVSPSGKVKGTRSSKYFFLPDVVEFVTETGELADDDHDRMSLQWRTGRTSRQNSGWPYKTSRQEGHTWNRTMGNWH